MADLYFTLQQVLTSSAINIECLPVGLVHIESDEGALRGNIISAVNPLGIDSREAWTLNIALLRPAVLEHSLAVSLLHNSSHLNNKRF